MIIKYIDLTKVKSLPNRAGTARPHATWKWKNMLKKMAVPVERIAEDEVPENTDDTDSVESYPDIPSIGDIGRTAPGILTSNSDISSPGTPSLSIPTPAHTLSYGKAKKTKDREPFYKKGGGVVYLP